MRLGLGEGERHYTVRMEDVLLAPDGEVVARHAFQHHTCVAVGTLIATPSGPQPVEQLKVGDAVWSYDARPGQRVARRVRSTVSSARHAFVDLDGLLVTPDHPVFTDGRFVPAGQLVSGSALLSVSGAHMALQTPTAVSMERRVVDLSIEAPHNYFAGGLLVHNKARYSWPGPHDDRWHGLFWRAPAAAK